MVLPKELTTVTKTSKILALILFMLLPFIGFYLGIEYKSKQMTYTTTSVSQNNSLNPNSNLTKSQKNCKSYGVDRNKDNLYSKYVVITGDSLLSIAKNELGDKSRIADIIYINNSNYPGLSIKNPYIEPGWILYLPPSYVKNIDVRGLGVPNLLYAASGELLSIKNEQWEIKLNQLNPSYTFNIDSNTQFIDKGESSYRVGDCLKAIMQEYDIRVYAIFPQ